MKDPNPLLDNMAEVRLESWKEIAAYFRRDVRTIQRWEKTENLPIHRHLHGKRGSVYAFKRELDEWRESRRSLVELDEASPPETIAASIPAAARTFSTAKVIVFVGLLLLTLVWTWRISSTEQTPLPKISRLLAYATSEGRRIARIPVGKEPHHMVITPAGEEIYVSNFRDDTVSVIQTSTGSVTHTLAVGGRPETLAISSDGRHVYVANVNGSLSIIDTKAKSVATLATEAPVSDIVVTPDNTAVYLAHMFSGLSRFVVNENRFESVQTPRAPGYLALNRGASKLYVNYQGGGSHGRQGHDSIEVIDTSDRHVIASIDGLPNVGGWLSLSADGSQLWANGNDACRAPAYDHSGCPKVPGLAMNVIRTSDNSLLKTLSFSVEDGIGPYVSFFPDSSHAVVGGEKIKVIDTETFTVTETLPGSSTGTVVFSKDYRRAYYVMNLENSVAVVDLPEESCFAPPAGLVGWWPGDGNANDIRNINHAELTGGVSFSAGRTGQAFHIDGPSAFIHFGSLDNLNTILDKEFTLAASLKFSSRSSTDDVVIADRMPAPGLNTDGWRLLRDSSNRILFCVGHDASSACKPDSTTAVRSRSEAPDTWFDVQAVKSRDSIALFIDGNLQARTPVGPYTQAGDVPMRFGSSGAGESWNGSVDEIQLYNRALSDREVKAIHRAATQNGCFPPS